MTEPKILELTPQWIAVDKPSGWLTVRPTNPSPVPILSDWVQTQHPDAKICHRLDVQTTGAVIFARGPQNHRIANEWFTSHRIKKIYHCICAGIPEMPVMKLDAAVRGSPATTQVQVKERFGGGTPSFLAEARIVTGRRHQIRIHLAGDGHPLLGDTQYGGSAVVPRVALHSFSIEFPNGERFTSPWPEDFRCWIDSLRANLPL